MLRTGQLHRAPPRPRDLARRQGPRYRGPWRLPGPDSHRLAAVSLRSATPSASLHLGARATGRTFRRNQPHGWSDATQPLCGAGCLRQRGHRQGSSAPPTTTRCLATVSRPLGPGRLTSPSVQRLASAPADGVRLAADTRDGRPGRRRFKGRAARGRGRGHRHRRGRPAGPGSGTSRPGGRGPRRGGGRGG
jgi:hypothetical protein